MFQATDTYGGDIPIELKMDWKWSVLSQMMIPENEP
jgi:hypothetical protein